MRQELWTIKLIMNGIAVSEKTKKNKQTNKPKKKKKKRSLCVRGFTLLPDYKYY